MYDLATLNPKRRGTQTGSIPFCKLNVSYEVCWWTIVWWTHHMVLSMWTFLAQKNVKKT